MSVTNLKLAQLSLGDSVTWTGTHTFSNAIVLPAAQTFNAAKLTIASQATGDLLYASSGSVWSRLGAGTNGYVLSLASGVPVWNVPTLTSVTNASAPSGVAYFSSDNLAICSKVGSTVYQLYSNYAEAALLSTYSDNTNHGDPLQVASAPALQIGSGSICVFAFFKLVTIGAFLQPWIGQYNLGSVAASSYLLCYTNSSGRCSFTVSNGTSAFEVDGGTNLVAGTWYLGAGIWDQPSGSVYVYLNAVSDAAAVTGASVHNATSNFVIGSTADLGNNACGCKIAIAGKISIGISQAPAFLTFLYAGGRGRNATAIINWLSLNGYPAVDALYAFENPTNLGLDSSANANNLTKALSIGPTSVSGPGLYGS